MGGLRCSWEVGVSDHPFCWKPQHARRAPAVASAVSRTEMLPHPPQCAGSTPFSMGCLPLSTAPAQLHQLWGLQRRQPAAATGQQRAQRTGAGLLEWPSCFPLGTPAPPTTATGGHASAAMSAKKPVRMETARKQLACGRACCLRSWLEAVRFTHWQWPCSSVHPGALRRRVKWSCKYPAAL